MALRTCLLHAGPHKTASSYIQSRLWRNRERLGDLGVLLLAPEGPPLKHKPLAAAMAQGRWQIWKQYLKRVNQASEHHTLVLSAEQFVEPLLQEKSRKRLRQILKRAGYQLRPLLFVRPQLELLNSHYGHGVRRLYHHLPFEVWIDGQLEQPRWHSELRFQSLIEESCTSFLPLAAAGQDPFQQLLQLILSDEVALHGINEEGWWPADSACNNRQPGSRGIWMAQELGRRLAAQGVPGRTLRNSGGIVRTIAEAHGWDQDRFWGFSPAMAAEVEDRFSEGNQAFAQRVWGVPWQSLFPSRQRSQQVYSPTAAKEHRMMENLLLRAYRLLWRQNRTLMQAPDPAQQVMAFLGC